jgi:hypothetical protein
MKSSLTRGILVSAFALLGALSASNEASACVWDCRLVGFFPLCYQCVDTGTRTNNTCIQLTACQCANIPTDISCIEQVSVGTEEQARRVSPGVALAGSAALCAAPAGEVVALRD